MKKIIIGALSVVIISGCASNPSNQVSAFAQSSHAITEQVDAVLTEFNSASLERKFTSIAANYKGDHAKKFNFDVLDAINTAVTPAQQTQLAIYRANQSLGQYAAALAALANADVQTDVDAASTELYGALTSFNSQYQTIKGDDVELFNQQEVATIQAAITAIGSEIVEQRRRKAIKSIILAAKDNINLVCDVIISQLNSAGIADGIALSRKFILANQIKEYRVISAKNSSKLIPRTKEVRRLWNLQQGMLNSTALVEQSTKGISEIKAAHATLADEVANDEFSSIAIANAIGRLQQINNHFKDLEISMTAGE